MPRPSALPLMLCLDLHVHTLDESKGIGSLHGNMDNSESQGPRSSYVNMDNSKFQGSESEGRSSYVNMDNSESEGRSLAANILDNAKSPATSRCIRSFNWDQVEGSYTLEWANFAKFKLWHQMEEHLSCIEFVISTFQTRILYSQWQCFVCRHQGSRGKKIYEKKHPEWKCKIEPKKSGCSFFFF